MDYIIDGAVLTGIADEIRTRSGSSGTIAPEEMANEVGKCYEVGYEAGYNKGLSEGRATLDLLGGIELKTQGAYYGKLLNSFGDQKLIMLSTLKKGKSVPSGSFGLIRNSSSTSASWIVTGGKHQPQYAHTTVVPSSYSWSMVGCYPATKATWDAFMDAFEVRVELYEEEK